MLGPGEVLTGEAPSVAATIAMARDRDLRVIAITDHNTIRNVSAAVALGSSDLLVLPGIEISTADGHLLGIFGSDQMPQLEDLVRPAILQLRELPSGGFRSTRSMAELIREIALRGGLSIPAHIDTADGLLAARSNNSSVNDVLCSPGLTALEITRIESRHMFTEADEDAARRTVMSDRRSVLGRDVPPRTMASDAHTASAVGLDEPHRVMTRLRIDELNFAGVCAALALYPQARCVLEADLSPTFAYAEEVRFEGGFLDGLTVPLNPNLNTLIGGRGSGKTTALIALRAGLGGDIDADLDQSAHMPDRTTVRFRDSMGAARTAVRLRGWTAEDGDAPGVGIRLPFLDLDQNFGMEFLTEAAADPTATAEFLLRFVDESDLELEETDLIAQLGENAASLRRTNGAGSKVKSLREERERLQRNLETAMNTKLVKVADLARTLSSEGPLLRDLEAVADDIEKVDLARPPDLDDLARAHDADLTIRPAKDFVEGATGLRTILTTLTADLTALEEEVRLRLSKATGPARERMRVWRSRHDKWETEIADRKAKLKAAGFSVQVDELDKLRRRLRDLDADIAKFSQWESDYQRAYQERQRLLENLNGLRNRRFEFRKRRTAELAAAASSKNRMRVTVHWERQGIRTEWGTRVGAMFGFHSPRSERLAAAVTPAELAAIGWRADVPALEKVRGQDDELFFDERAEERMGQLRSFDALFELETFDLGDLPEIRVWYPGDPPGPGKSLRHRSLGQVRSVLLGFILSAPGSEPLILDQPEEQLDGPFLADVVVGYLHSAKERRQVIVATHSANVTVLGDAELVLPLAGESGNSRLEEEGSVDRVRTRGKIVRILEGGRDAFIARARRYGITSEELA